MDIHIIRFFLSSTFKEMNNERNIIQEKVFARLRFWAREFGIFLIPVDLRWGITEKDIEQGNLTQICLDAVKECSPYFIGLLGNCYGTTDKKILGKNKGKSITQLEIEKRLDCENNNDGIILYKINYSKHKENNFIKKHKQKTFLRILRKKCELISIDNEERLIVNINNDLKNLIKRKFKKIIPQNNLEHDDYVYKNFYKSYYASTVIQNCAKNIRFDNKVILETSSRIWAEFLIYNISNDLMEKGKTVIFHDFSTSDYTQDKKGLIEHVLDVLKFNVEDFEENTEDDWFNKAVQNRDQDLYLFVNALDLLDKKEINKILMWLANIDSDKIKIIITGISGEDWKEKFNSIKYRDLSMEEVKKYTLEYLKFYYKACNNDLANDICLMVGKYPQCQNIAYLNFLLEQIIQSGCSSDQVLNKLEEYLACSDFCELLKKVLRFCEENIQKEIVQYVEYIIGSSYQYLLISDIERLLSLHGWQNYYAEEVLENFINIIVVAGNRIYPKYKELKIIADEIPQKISDSIDNEIVDYFEQEIQNGHINLHTINELIYCYQKKKDSKKIAGLLFKCDVFVFAVKNCINQFSVLLKDASIDIEEYCIGLYKYMVENNYTKHILTLMKFLRYIGKFQLAINLFDDYASLHQLTHAELYYKAHILRELGRWNDSIEILEPLYEKYVQQKTPLAMYLRICDTLSYCYSKLYKFDKALELVDDCIKLREYNMQKYEYDLPISLNSKANILYNKMHFSDARTLYKKAAEIRMKYWGSSNVRLAANIHNIGQTYMGDGNYSKAMEYFEKSIKMLESNLGDNHYYILSSKLQKYICCMLRGIKSFDTSDMNNVIKELEKYNIEEDKIVLALVRMIINKNNGKQYNIKEVENLCKKCYNDKWELSLYYKFAKTL